MTGLASVWDALFPRGGLDGLSQYDKFRFMTLLRLNWFSILIVLLVTFANAYVQKYDRALGNFSQIFIILLPTLWLTYHHKIATASWYFILTTYGAILAGIYARVHQAQNPYLEFNFILICLYALVLLDGKVSLVMGLLAAIVFFASRLFISYYLVIPLDTAQLFSGFIVFSVLIYFSLMTKKMVLERQELISQKNAQLEDANRELTDLNNLKNTLFGIIGHDLRSPLSTLKIQLSNLANDPSASVLTGTSRFAHIQQLTDNVYTTTDNLLNWSLLQRGGLTVWPTRFDLFIPVDMALDLFNSQIRQKMLTVITSFAPAPVFADEYQIQVVVRNLIHNAIKFTPSQGTIWLTTESANDQSVLRIRDTGVGMEPRLASQPLTTLTSQMGTAGERGIGLGLSICRELMEHNQGTMTFASLKDKGTTVTLSWPIG